MSTSIRSPTRSADLPAELAQIHLNISQNLLKEAELLAKAEALEADCHREELDHRVILDQIEHATFEPVLPSSYTPLPPIPSSIATSPLIPLSPSSMAPSPLLAKPIMIPTGGHRELSDPSILLLKDLWTRMGYQGSAYIGIQKEISKELAHADFARFERQMLCNEILALKQENQSICQERNDHLRRANTVQANLNKVIEAEDRTFQTLMAERKLAKNVIKSAQRGVENIVLENEKEIERSRLMSQELSRLEKEKSAALRYAKTAEEQATMASITAKAATAVAVSAVHESRPVTPRLTNSTLLTPRLPANNFAPRMSSAAGTYSTWGRASPSCLSSTYDISSRSPFPQNSGSHCDTINGSYATGSGWSAEDETALMAKMREREMRASVNERNQFHPGDQRSARDRFNSRFERDRMSNLPSDSRPVASSSSTYHPQNEYQQQPRKKVDWNEPLIGPSSTTAKRY